MHILNATETDQFRTLRRTAAPLARHRRPKPAYAFGVLLLATLIGGCDQHAQGEVRTGGNPETGASLIQRFGCGTCHTITGIAGAEGQVGPPLDSIGRRGYIAGKLRNTPENMVRWLMNPQAVWPGNVMPNMGLGEAQARDVAAYLYTLQ